MKAFYSSERDALRTMSKSTRPAPLVQLPCFALFSVVGSDHCFFLVVAVLRPGPATSRAPSRTPKPLVNPAVHSGEMKHGYKSFPRTGAVPFLPFLSVESWSSSHRSGSCLGKMWRKTSGQLLTRREVFFAAGIGFCCDIITACTKSALSVCYLSITGGLAPQPVFVPRRIQSRPARANPLSWKSAKPLRRLHCSHKLANGKLQAWNVAKSPPRASFAVNRSRVARSRSRELAKDNATFSGPSSRTFSQALTACLSGVPSGHLAKFEFTPLKTIRRTTVQRTSG